MDTKDLLISTSNLHSAMKDAHINAITTALVEKMSENMETMLPAFLFKDDKERQVFIERTLIAYEMGVKAGIYEFIKREGRNYENKRMKARVKKTGEQVDVYHEPQHGQMKLVYKEALLVNGRTFTEDELEFIDTPEVEVQKNLWHDAQGDYLPKFDREVIVLTTNGKVFFAHRPDPQGYWGRSVIHGEMEHFTPQTYGKGGWNIPDVEWWLDCPLPKCQQ